MDSQVTAGSDQFFLLNNVMYYVSEWTSHAGKS